jgi:hypothetical protein
MSLFFGFEPLSLIDVEHKGKASYHWHLLAEKRTA